MKRLIFLIKWLPFALVVLMVLHCLLLLCGIYSNFLAHNGVSPLLYIVMLVLSYKLDFCCFHRLALHYDLAARCFCQRFRNRVEKNSPFHAGYQKKMV